MPGCELGHHGAACSFDAILTKHRLTDPALETSQIVRAADTADKSWAAITRIFRASVDGRHRLTVHARI